MFSTDGGRATKMLNSCYVHLPSLSCLCIVNVFTAPRRLPEAKFSWLCGTPASGRPWAKKSWVAGASPWDFLFGGLFFAS